jgi:hypothetical protein
MGGRSWGLLLMAVAVVLVLVAARLVARTLRRMRAGGRARGVVVGNEKTFASSGQGQPYFRRTVRFAANDGRSHTFTSPVGRGRPWVEGAKVDVIYDPADPADAEIAGFATNWLIPLALAVFAAVSLMVGLGLLSSH